MAIKYFLTRTFVPWPRGAVGAGLLNEFPLTVDNFVDDFHYC